MCIFISDYFWGIKGLYGLWKKVSPSRFWSWMHSANQWQIICRMASAYVLVSSLLKSNLIWESDIFLWWKHWYVLFWQIKIFYLNSYSNNISQKILQRHKYMDATKILLNRGKRNSIWRSNALKRDSSQTQYLFTNSGCWACVLESKIFKFQFNSRKDHRL